MVHASAAVAPGSAPAPEAAVNVFEDLRVKARSLRLLHERWIDTAQVPPGVRPVVARAWQRQEPGKRHDPVPIPSDAVYEHRSRASDLAGVVPVIRNVVLDLAAQAGNELVVCDADGVVLWMAGPSRVRRLSERLGFVEGACWTEASVGTNALGTALAERRPMQMFGAEHSDPGHHGWVCTGAPILDPRSGQPLGAITLSGPLVSAHPFTLALVREAAARAEDQLRDSHRESLRRLAGHDLGTGARIVVDEEGWVAAAVGFQVPERVRLPRSVNDGARIWVSGLGWFDSRRIAGGYVLRPRRTAAQLSLDLGGIPAAVVTTTDGTQRIPLTPRQVGIIGVLAQHPQGLDAQTLGELVYQAPTSAVTVRAEISRLRRKLGGLLEARPYRLTVDCNVLQP